MEYGIEEAVKTVDRNIYAEDQYPYGQWDYQKFYETDFEKASAFFDADIPAVLRALRLKGNPERVGKPSPTAHVSKDGGWMGGVEKPDPKYRHIPLEYTVYDSEETYNEFVAAMEKTGFWAADAWYSNHGRNRAYTLENRKNEGNLEFPVLFVSHSVLSDVRVVAVREIPLTQSNRSTQRMTLCAQLPIIRNSWRTCVDSART